MRRGLHIWLCEQGWSVEENLFLRVVSQVLEREVSLSVGEQLVAQPQVTGFVASP